MAAIWIWDILLLSMWEGGKVLAEGPTQVASIMFQEEGLDAFLIFENEGPKCIAASAASYLNTGM